MVWVQKLEDAIVGLVPCAQKADTRIAMQNTRAGFGSLVSSVRDNVGRTWEGAVNAVKSLGGPGGAPAAAPGRQ